MLPHPRVFLGLRAPERLLLMARMRACTSGGSPDADATGHAEDDQTVPAWRGRGSVVNVIVIMVVGVVMAV